MEQKIIKVEATCSTPLREAVDKKISEMNANGFRLVGMTTIPAVKGDKPDQHGMSYGFNEAKEMIFEKP